MAEIRAYSADKKQLLNRLRRAEGQVRGIQRMVEEDRYCIDVVTQISAIQSALDNVALALLDTHARTCMSEPRTPKQASDQVNELMGAVGRMINR